MLDSYELLKRRLNALGGNQEGRMRKEKLSSLLKALKYSEQAETLIKDGKEYKALISKNKQKMDYDDKNISIPYEAEFKVGDVFHWVEDNSDWIVYLREGQDAYFTGICRKAIYNIRWKDEFDVYHTMKAAVRGPVETKVKSEIKSGMTYDKPNYSLYVLAPATEDSRKLARYSRVAIDGVVWKVEVVDSTSEPGILELQLNEDYLNKDQDVDLVKPSDEMCEFIPSDNIKVVCSLDKIKTLEINESFNLWAYVEKDGDRDEKILEGLNFTLLGGVGRLTEDNILYGLMPGKIAVKLKIPKLCYEKNYEIDITEAAISSATIYEIEGDSVVKSFGENTYTIHYYLDGLVVDIENGKWSYKSNNSLFKAIENGNEIKLIWNVGNRGMVNLQYTVNNSVVAEKQIKVESLI